jgi:hypothetical protein
MLYFLQITDFFLLILGAKSKVLYIVQKKSKQKLLFITVAKNLIYYFIASHGNVLHTVKKVILLLLLQISANYIYTL